MKPKRRANFPKTYRSKRRTFYPPPTNPLPNSIFMQFVLAILLLLPIALQQLLHVFFESSDPPPSVLLSLPLSLSLPSSTAQKRGRPGERKKGPHRQRQKNKGAPPSPTHKNTEIDQTLMLRGAIIALAALENGTMPHLPWQTLYKTFHKNYPNHPYVYPAPKMVYSERSAILQGSGNALAPHERLSFEEAGNHLPFSLKLRFPDPLFFLPLFFHTQKQRRDGPVSKQLFLINVFQRDYKIRTGKDTHSEICIIITFYLDHFLGMGKNRRVEPGVHSFVLILDPNGENDSRTHSRNLAGRMREVGEDAKKTKKKCFYSSTWSPKKQNAMCSKLKTRPCNFLLSVSLSLSLPLSLSLSFSLSPHSSFSPGSLKHSADLSAFLPIDDYPKADNQGFCSYVSVLQASSLLPWLVHNSEKMKHDLYLLLEKAESYCDLMRFQREVACQAGDYVSQFFHPLAKTSDYWASQHYDDPKEREHVVYNLDGSEYVGPEKVEVVSEKVKMEVKMEEEMWEAKIAGLSDDEECESEDGGHESDGLWVPTADELEELEGLWKM